MKNFAKLSAVFLLILTSSCASTHGNFISEHHDAWIDGYSSKSNRADKGLLFCRANIKEDGLADPVCYEARFEEYEDEKERVTEKKKKEERAKKKESKESQASSEKEVVKEGKDSK